MFRAKKVFITWLHNHFCFSEWNDLPKTVRDIYELMPKKDCGLCGNPSCRTAARKIATGDMTVDQCANLKLHEFKENKERILQLLKEGVEVGAKGTIVIGEEGITYIHPCISEAGRVAAEAKLTSGPEGTVQNLKYGFFDPIVMCWALNTSGLFKNVRCSPRLGTAIINLNGKTVTVFHDGRITVRRAKDKQDAIQAIRLTSRALWASIICSCCGNAGVDCASGGCEDCLTKICPVLAGGPPDPLSASTSPTGQTTGSTIFERAKTIETGKYFEKGFQNLDQAMEAVNQSAHWILNGRFSSKQMDSIKVKIDEANNLAIRFVVETPRVQDATMGLILAGVTLDVTRMLEGLEVLVRSNKQPSEELKELLLTAVEIAGQAYQALRAVNLDQAKQITSKYVEFKKAWGEAFRKNKEEQDMLVAIEKIAANGFYIARLLTKPLPT